MAAAVVTACHSGPARSVSGPNEGEERPMKVFVAGATGVIGRRLVPQLISAGHDVVGTFNSIGKADTVRALGAKPVALDLLDAGAVRRAVASAQPDAIVHEATALTGISDFKHFDRSFAQTNRLRIEG